MFEISPESFAALSRASDANFLRRLAKVVREAVPSLQAEPEASLQAQLHILVQDARRYGLGSEQEMGVYAVTAGMLGVDFVDTMPAARDILTSSETAERKAAMLEKFTIHLFDTLER